MHPSPTLQGVICPLVTPFDEQGAIDLPALRQVVDFLLAGDIDGLMVGGTTGEGMLLNLDERKMLLDAVVEHAAGRAAVIAHTGCVSTAETLELTQHAAAAGATAASAIVPYFFTFDEESIFRHFGTIADAVPDLPLLLYAFPGNAKNDISPSLLRRLLDVAGNIVGIKSSNPDLLRFQAYIETGGPDFIAICGVDGLMLPALAQGAHGQISGNANAFPELFKALYAAFRAGDLDRARVLQATVDRVRHALGDGVHPAYFKGALRRRGVPAGRVRPPMRELSPAESERLAQELESLLPMLATL